MSHLIKGHLAKRSTENISCELLVVLDARTVTAVPSLESLSG
jgi:hypothetical protein